jgi:hypothetical protein
MNITSMFGRVNQRIINNSPANETQLPPRQFMALKYSDAMPGIKVAESIPKIDLVNVDAVKTTATMKWGKPTWYFLHTLAEKISEDNFKEVRKDLLEIVYSICTNLPCPDCANHARTYLDGINYNNIETKQDLKMMLFVFHNTVNKRKGYTIFTLDELNQQYSMAITDNIIQYFLSYYLAKNPTPQMIANDMFRRRIILNIQKWLIDKKSYFM